MACDMDFLEPLGGHFTYATWNIDLRLRGPFVHASKRRQDRQDTLRETAGSLSSLAGVESVRLFESTVIPPIDGGPRYDLALLALADRPLLAEVRDAAATTGLPDAEFVATARNVARFGDTEDGNGHILLNHFAGDVAPKEAIETWKSVSQWYADALETRNEGELLREPYAPGTVTASDGLTVLPGIRTTTSPSPKTSGAATARIVRTSTRSPGVSATTASIRITPTSPGLETRQHQEHQQHGLSQKATTGLPLNRHVLPRQVT